MKKEISKTEKTAKKVAGTAAAITVAAGVIVNGAVASPSDLVSPGAPGPISICQIDGQTEDGAEDDGEDSEDKEDSAVKLSIKQRIARWLMSLPLTVRVFIALPLWGIGCVVNGALSALWTDILSPSMGTIIRWISFAAMVVIAVLAIVRVILPDMPVKHILCRRNLRIIIIGAVILGIFCAAAPLFIENFPRYDKLIEAAGLLIISGIVTVCCLIDDKHAYIVKSGDVFN